MSEHLISIREAVAEGITQLRLDHWANTRDHIRLNLISAKGRPWREMTPWVELWSPTNDIIGAPNPQKFLFTMLADLDARVWREYDEESP